jgi:CRISPR/Cas system-associated exonuclease Cas4 (RecB family)
MSPDYATARPSPIDRISPSLANSLLACELRAAFTLDSAFDHWRRPSTFSVLGDAAHAVTEEAMKRSDWSPDELTRRAVLSDLWDRVVQTGVEGLAAAWAPSVPPPPEEWPAYQLTKSRTIRRAVRLTQPLPAAPRFETHEDPQEAHRAKLGAHRAGVGVEVDMADPGSILHGRADRIERVGSATRVVDLKSGMHQGEPEGDQLRQLHLYAVLVHRTTGQWPVEIAIENASGELFALPLRPQDAEESLEQVLAAVDRFNEAVSGAASFSASPGEATCKWCPYRAVCEPYWDVVTAEWGHASVLGTVVETGTNDQGAHVTIQVRNPADHGADVAIIAQLAAIPEGGSDWISAVDLTPIRDPTQLRARWSTRVMTW